MNESEHAADPTDGMADGTENFYEEENEDEEEMQGEPLYIIQELD